MCVSVFKFAAQNAIFCCTCCKPMDVSGIIIQTKRAEGLCWCAAKRSPFLITLARRARVNLENAAINMGQRVAAGARARVDEPHIRCSPSAACVRKNVN